jgi:hypothetical protein
MQPATWPPTSWCAVLPSASLPCGIAPGQPGNSHPLNTHRYQLTTTRYIVLQRISLLLGDFCPFSIYLCPFSLSLFSPMEDVDQMVRVRGLVERCIAFQVVVASETRPRRGERREKRGCRPYLRNTMRASATFFDRPRGDSCDRLTRVRRTQVLCRVVKPKARRTRQLLHRRSSVGRRSARGETRRDGHSTGAFCPTHRGRWSDS